MTKQEFLAQKDLVQKLLMKKNKDSRLIRKELNEKHLSVFKEKFGLNCSEIDVNKVGVIFVIGDKSIELKKQFESLSLFSTNITQSNVNEYLPYYQLGSKLMSLLNDEKFLDYFYSVVLELETKIKETYLAYVEKQKELDLEIEKYNEIKRKEFEENLKVGFKFQTEYGSYIEVVKITAKYVILHSGKKIEKEKFISKYSEKISYFSHYGYLVSVS